MSQLSEWVFPTFRFSLPLLCCHRNQTVTSSLCPSPAAAWASAGLVRYWGTEGVNVWLWTNKTTTKNYSNNIAVRARLCLPEECCLCRWTHRGHAYWHDSRTRHTWAVHAARTWAPDLCVGAEACLHLRPWSGPTWPRRVLMQEKGYYSAFMPHCLLCGKSIYASKGTCFPFFFSKVEQASPSPISFGPFWSIIPKYFLQDETSIQQISHPQAYSGGWATSKFSKCLGLTMN